MLAVVSLCEYRNGDREELFYFCTILKAIYSP